MANSGILKGRFGIVTGGSRGIGEAIARNLAAKGCDLLLNYTSASSQGPTEKLCSELASAHGIRVESVQADLGKPEEGVQVILAAAQKFSSSGKLQIDILINNAGVSADHNLNDPVRGPDWTRELPLASIYGGTKAALEAMTRTWARELADRATVNSINPGPVIGDMYFKAGEAFWRDLQGFVDNAPLSKLDLNNKDVTSRLTEDQIRLINEKMGGRRPAFTSEIAGTVGMLCTPDGAWTTAVLSMPMAV
ncbi:hypothetical protein N7470_007729 [Penicillium chermesinum]|nr:hypothetical protein N7470_007729 [Penicillium chermesinum]